MRMIDIKGMISEIFPRIRQRLPARLFAIIVVVAMIISLVGCLDTEEGEEVIRPADYGSYGRDIAEHLASRWPNRTPGSDQESETADYIEDAFSELGYEPELQTFTFISDTEEVLSSQNVIVRIEGEGFTFEDDSGSSSVVRKTAVIGAHYDVNVTSEQAENARLEREQSETDEIIDETESETEESSDNETNLDSETEEEELFSEIELPMPTLDEFDGIHNNAAGVGVLLTLSKQLKNFDPRYDIILIAFGAGNAGNAGSRAFVSDLDTDEIETIDVMYNIDGIYAGDKVYAHSGHNSVVAGEEKLYEKRRKLYEATDVYYENELYTNNRFALYTNQSGIKVPWGNIEGGETAIYREWTLRESDHTPFDQLGIPIVFFDSYDYNSDNLENMKESSNPAFAATEGQIKGTAFDSSEYLFSLFELTQNTSSNQSGNYVSTDILTRRINNIAFILEGSVKKGMHNADNDE